jgi:hypothetical protein
MKKFKDIFDYNNLLLVFKKANIIEHIIEKENIEIDYEKLNDESILLNILYILEKYQNGLVNKIENINVMSKINELNFKNKFNYKRVIYNNEDYKNGNQLIINYIDDFEIINLDIFNLLQKLNIKLNPISGDYIIEYKKIYLFVYVYNICEIGNFDKQGNFNIEYLFNINEFGYKILKNYFQNYGINNYINIFDKNKEINYIYYKNYKIPCYKFDKGKILKDVKQNKQNEQNDYIKIKALILISIYQNKICKNKNIEEEVFLINKNYLYNFYYDKINNMIINNHKIQNFFFFI